MFKLSNVKTKRTQAFTKLIKCMFHHIFFFAYLIKNAESVSIIAIIVLILLMNILRQWITRFSMYQKSVVTYIDIGFQEKRVREKCYLAAKEL